MKVQGIATLVFRDAETGEITHTEKDKFNHVQNHWFDEMSTYPTAAKFGNNIFLATAAGITEQKRDQQYVYDQATVGVNEAGVTSPELTYGADPAPHVIRYQQRFAPPASDKTINVIGLTNDVNSTAGVASYGYVNSQTWVFLASPCIQLTTETLDIFYRVQFVYDAAWKSAGPTSTALNFAETKLLLSTRTYSTWICSSYIYKRI